MKPFATLVTALVFLIGPSPSSTGQEGGKKRAGAEVDPRLAPVKDLRDILLILAIPGKGASLTAQDAKAIAKGCPSVRAAAPVVRARDTVSTGKRKWVPVYIYGTTPDYLAVRDRQKLAAGQPFTGKDVANQAAVCLLGQTVARKLFDKESALGKEVRIEKDRLKVVGVLESKGANAMGLDQDDIVLLPWTTLASRKARRADNKGKSPTAVDQIVVRKRAGKGAAEANREVTAFLQERRKIARGQADDFSIRDFSEFEKLLEKARP
jgi:ABC-type antimicrobial peptide transport system permease subunit